MRPPRIATGRAERPNNTEEADFAYLHSNGTWYLSNAATEWVGLIEIEGDPVDPSRSKLGGPQGQYLLQVKVSDEVPPQFEDIDRIPIGGGTIRERWAVSR